MHSLSNVYRKHALCQVRGKQRLATHSHTELSTLKKVSQSIYQGILLLGFEKGT